MPKNDAAGRRSPAEKSQRDLSTGAGTGSDAKSRGEKSGRSGAKRTKRSDAPKGISGVPGSKNDSRRCTATAHRTGERCKAPAILGGTVCRVHGGATPNVKKKAKERLLSLLDPALAALHRVLTDDNADDSVKVRAALGILDRTGYGPNSKLDLNVGLTRFEEALTEAYGGEVIDGKAVFPEGLKRNGGVDRSEMLDPPDNRPALAVGVGVDEPWEDAEQHAYDERERQWAEYDAEDEKPYTTRLDPFGPDVVRGEVVPPVVRPGSARPDPGPLDPPGYDPERGRWG